MRIIGGNLKGKNLYNPLDKLRPLKDMVRESIFNILNHSNEKRIDLKNSNILDIFSGSGSFGIECLSRGAKNVIFIENYANSLIILKKNLNYLGLESRSNIFKIEALKINKYYLKNINFDLVFLDGSHRADDVYKEISLALDSLKPSGFILLHDYYPNSKPVPGPNEAVKRIQKENKLINIYHFSELSYFKSSEKYETCLAILYKK